MYLREREEYPVIIATTLNIIQEKELIQVPKHCRKAIGRSIEDLIGISPNLCIHHIFLEEDIKPIRLPQRRLNLPMREVVKAEVIKLLGAGIIYSISDSTWVSPTQVVLKKGGIIYTTRLTQVGGYVLITEN